MEQSPLKFEVPSNTTVDLAIVTTGHEKDRFTVRLACLGDGLKLPPYVIFKRKTLLKELIFPQGIHDMTEHRPKAGWIKNL